MFGAEGGPQKIILIGLIRGTVEYYLHCALGFYSSRNSFSTLIHFYSFGGVVIFEGAASLALRRLLALLVGSLLGSNEVDGRTSLEEINLVGRHGVSGSEVVGRAVRLGSSHLDKATVVTTLLKHVQEVQGLQSVAGLDLVVVGLVLKGQRKHTLLLEVGLVNSSERLD